MQPLNLAQLPYIQAKWYTPAEGRTPTLLVVHVMEAPDKPHTARNVARYFADGCEGRKASAHFCVDAEEIVHCVQLKDVAYGAPGANRNGIHVEHAGYSAQKAADWADPYNEKMLHLSAQLVKQLAARYQIPLVWLSAQDVHTGKSGITSHANITVGLKDQYPNSTHMDPGVGFPVQHYMALLNQK